MITPRRKKSDLGEEDSFKGEVQMPYKSSGKKSNMTFAQEIQVENQSDS